MRVEKPFAPEEKADLDLSNTIMTLLGRRWEIVHINSTDRKESEEKTKVVG